MLDPPGVVHTTSVPRASVLDWLGAYTNAINGRVAQWASVLKVPSAEWQSLPSQP